MSCASQMRERAAFRMKGARISSRADLAVSQCPVMDRAGAQTLLQLHLFKQEVGHQPAKTPGSSRSSVPDSSARGIRFTKYHYSNNARHSQVCSEEPRLAATSALGCRQPTDFRPANRAGHCHPETGFYPELRRRGQCSSVRLAGARLMVSGNGR